MNFVYSLLMACVLAAVEGRLVRRQVPGIPRPVIPPVVPRINPLAVNPLGVNPLAVNPLAVNPLAVNPLNNVPIISYVNENNFDGSYKFSYETGNGISVAEEGYLKNAGGGEEVEAQTSSGSYSYTAPDGQLIQVTWYADENGFHAQTGHGTARQPGFPVQANLRTAPAPLPRPIFNAPV